MQQGLVGSAHLIAGSRAAVPHLLAFLKKQGIDAHANPDVYVREYARFGADDARELRERAALRSTGKTGRIFIFATPTLTTEAQNVLLKTFEEPPAGAMFFLIVPSPHTLLQTLRSRMQTLELQRDAGDDVIDTEKFLAASAEKRLDMLKPLLEKDDDDKRDLRPILTFLASVEAGLARAAHAHGFNAALQEGIASVYRARMFIGDKGALVKPLLEQVALLVPTI